MTQIHEAESLPVEVSRETRSLLGRHIDLVEKWSPTINLIARDSLNEVWARHVLDSAQLLPIALALKPEGALHWCDMGSGAGFPGLVIAILAREIRPDLRVTLVESNGRKATFLRNAVLRLQLSVTVHRARIEQLPCLAADVISARALAPLDHLLRLAEPHLAEDGVCLFPKGARWREEVTTALASWRFRLQDYPSMTDPSGAILKIEDLHRV